MSEMKHCCERLKKLFDGKVIGKDISGYWIWLALETNAYGNSDSDWELIEFCPFCGKKLMKREVVKKDKPQDTSAYASLRR